MSQLDPTPDQTTGEQKGAELLTDLMEQEVGDFISCSSQEGWDANSCVLSWVFHPLPTELLSMSVWELVYLLNTRTS